MDHETLCLVFLFAIILLSMLAVVTLIIVARLYSMHNVRNNDGEYAWMVPRRWVEMQDGIVKSQERMVEALDRSSENQFKMTKLLESLTNATLALNESVNGGGNGKRQ